MVCVKEWYVVTFKWSEHIYCTNLVQTDDLEKIKEHYTEYEDVSFSPCKEMGNRILFEERYAKYRNLRTTARKTNTISPEIVSKRGCLS